VAPPVLLGAVGIAGPSNSQTPGRTATEEGKANGNATSHDRRDCEAHARGQDSFPPRPRIAAHIPASIMRMFCSRGGTTIENSANLIARRNRS
jgi:hypothetical protein